MIYLALFVKKFRSTSRILTGKFRPIFLFFILILFFVLVGLAWRYTPLGSVLGFLKEYVPTLRDDPRAPGIILGIFVLGTLVGLPLNVMILLSVLTFDGGLGGLYAFMGSTLSALPPYGLGRWLGRRENSFFSVDPSKGLGRRLSNPGLSGIALLRILPLAPFPAVNLAAGTFRVPLLAYIGGTALGLLPGVTVLSLFGASLLDFLQNPDATGFAILSGFAVLLLTLLWFLSNRFRKGERRTVSEEAPPADNY